jgi:TonB-dependent receptor
MRRASILSAALFCLLSFMGFAQTGKGSLTGHVTDSSGAELQGASVMLIETGRTTATDSKGGFILTDINPGSYHLQVTFVGFSDSVSEVKLAAGQVQQLRIALKVESANEQIVVVAERVHGEAEAINRIKTGDNILQIATHEVITSLPNANMADAIGRMPSVTLERDEGEGKYIQVRGTEPRLTNVTINGNTIPSPEGGVRQIKLDSVASDLVESVELNKTLSANQDADGIGGSVNFVTKTAGDQPTLSVTGIGGYTPIEQGRPVSQFSATLGKRFGASKKFGILGGGAYDFNGRGIDDIEPAFTGLNYTTLQTREYRYNRSRYGFTGGADYKLKEGSSLYLKGMFSDFYDYGDKWYYGYVQNARPTYYTSQRRPEFGVSSINLGGKHTFGANSLHWDLSASYSWQDAANGNPKADFYWAPASGVAPTSVSYSVDTSDSNRPKFNPTNTTLAAIQTPSNWALQDLYTSTGRAGALGLTGQGDYQRIHKFGSRYGTFSFGAKLRNLHRGQNAAQNIYDIGGTASKPTAAMAAGAYGMQNFLGDFTNPDYYGGSYQLGPVTDYNTILKAALNSSSPLLQYDKSATYKKGAINNYNLVERISAGYLMEGVDLTSHIHLQGGLRFENSYESGSGFNYDQTTVTLSKTPVNQQVYLDVLPSIQLRYSPNPNANLRIVYSRGVSRPDPLDLIPYIQETDGGTGICPASVTCAGTLNMGNPNLKPERAHNVDVLYEHFLKPLGMIQAGFFYKRLSDPLIQTQSVVTWDSQQWQGTQWSNGGDADLYGFEIGFQQRLSYLPGALSGLGVSANYSYTDSEARGIPYYASAGVTTYRTAPLLRQAPQTWNISPTYDRGRVSIRLGMQYNSAYVFKYVTTVAPGDDSVATGSAGPYGDDHIHEHFQLDAQGSVRLYKGLNFLAYGLNLNNEPFGHFLGSTSYMIQREFYRPTFAFGFRWTQRQE